MIYYHYVKLYLQQDNFKTIESIINLIYNFRENLLYFELIDILRSPELVKAMTGAWSEKFDS